MARQTIKVGMVGTGNMGQGVHLPAWHELEEEGRVELLGVCDLIPERVEGAAQRFGARKIHIDYRKMLREDHYDIIDVCTHNRFHCPVAIAALEAGANVIVEKPMAMNARESEAMIAAAKSAERKLMVAQHMRFESEHEKLKEIILRGELGVVYTANAEWVRRRGLPGGGKFHIKKESRGGPLIDLGVHVLDLTLWLLGFPKVVSVNGKTWRMFGDRKETCNCNEAGNVLASEFDVEDYANAYIRLENDIVVMLQVSWASNIDQERVNVAILGDKAGITTDPPRVYGAMGNGLTTTHFDWLPQQAGHRFEIRHFAECVEKNLPVRVKPDESLQVQRIIDAIYKSADTNREVRLSS